jgi:hypothetical protein
LALASPAFLTDLEASMERAGVLAAVAAHDTAAIFDWLMSVIQLQGISDSSAFAFSARHGLPTYHGIEVALARAGCPRLRSY